jgi:hypothetical protein
MVSPAVPQYNECKEAGIYSQRAGKILKPCGSTSSLPIFERTFSRPGYDRLVLVHYSSSSV